jgi:hypothetical protein
MQKADGRETSIEGFRFNIEVSDEGGVVSNQICSYRKSYRTVEETIASSNLNIGA